MDRKRFLRLIPAAGISPYFLPFDVRNDKRTNDVQATKADTREYWIHVMQKLADPVLRNLGAGKLKVNMPVESRGSDRHKYTHLEAFGRTLAGIAPWLELGPDESTEVALRASYIKLNHECISNAVDPASPDFMNFTEGGQPLVDVAQPA